MSSLGPAVQLPGIDVEARLALAEFLLTSIDVQASSRRAIDCLFDPAVRDEPVDGAA